MGFGAGQAMKLEERATAEILDKAQVVATTCVGAGDPRLAGRTFRICAIDEATQAPTPPLPPSSAPEALVVPSCRISNGASFCYLKLPLRVGCKDRVSPSGPPDDRLLSGFYIVAGLLVSGPFL